MKLKHKKAIFLCVCVFVFSTMVLMIFVPSNQFVYPIPMQYVYFITVMGNAVFFAFFLKIGQIVPKKSRTCLLLLIMLFIIGVLTPFVSKPFYSMRYVMIFSSLSIMTIYICYSLPIAYIPSILILYCIIVTLYSIFAIVLPLDGGGISILGIKFAQRSYKYMAIKRMSSFTQSPNLLGDIIVKSIPMSLYSIVVTIKSRIGATAMVICLITNIYALIHTYSRSSIAGSLISGTIFILLFLSTYNTTIRNKVIVGVLTTFVAVFVYAKIISPDLDLKTRFAENELSNVGERKSIWDNLSVEIQKRPLIGVGFGASDEVLYQITGGNNASAHNLYLGIVLETGYIISIGLFLFLFLVVIKTCILIIRLKEKQSRMLAGALLASYIGIFTEQFGEFLLFRTHSSHFIFLMLYSFMEKIYSEKKKLN